MNFSSQIDSLMKPFINSFGKCDKTNLSKPDKKTFNSILISLYHDIYESNKTIFKEGCFKHQVITDLAQIKKPDVSNSRYFPVQIQDYIKNNTFAQLIFSCGNVGNREINIHFTLFTESDLQRIEAYIQHVRMMYIWLNICAKYASKHCTNVLNIYIYPTPFTKNLPGSTTTVIGPEHVNTAFTYACLPNGQLIIFREEEWFKVFIHETFHAYGLDFATSDITALKQSISTIFPINSEFSIYEAYTETWARIINCAFCSFNAIKVKKRNNQTFLVNVNFCIEMERMFSLYQCIKILGFMGLQYQDLHGNESNKKNLYRENTHVFAYYIMTAIFLNDYQGFLLWCHTNNENLLKFNNSHAGFNKFTEYIESIYNCLNLQNGIYEMSHFNQQINKTNKKSLMNTMRMSIIHTI